MWDFTIDDALISIRYAQHLATGAGYRFNVGDAPTDGVTPLPWAFVLAPLARGDALSVLLRAKVLGLAAWTIAAMALGAAIGRTQARAYAKAIALGAIAACVPVAAHAVSGMETGLVIALATWAALARSSLRASAIAGVVAAFRPEMIVWAVTLAACRGSRRGMLVATLPLVSCGIERQIAFGRAAPLAVLAKPSDLGHGLAYAGAAALVCVAPLLVLAPMALAKARGVAAALVVAGLAHFAAIAAAGGDWMPFARLAAPVAPSLVYAFVLASPFADRSFLFARAGFAFVLAAVVFVLGGAASAGRHVGANYRALIAAAHSVLADARSVASLDIGWPSAAVGSDVRIVDLAGLTDPYVAALPGGHTSKRVDAAFLLARDPDVLLLYAKSGVGPGALDGWQSATYGRVVDARLAGSDLVAAHFKPRAFLPYGPRGEGYVVLVQERAQ